VNRGSGIVVRESWFVGRGSWVVVRESRSGGAWLVGFFFLCVLSDNLLLDVGRDYFIMAERHRVTAASAGNAL